MREYLQAVLDLQPEWVAAGPSGAMRLRKRHIREDIAGWIGQHANDLAERLRCGDADLVIEGKDATGNYSRVPWVRIADSRNSKNPRTGWYVVYLFAEDGNAVFLSLNQGTQLWDGSGLRSQPTDQIRARSRWAREVLHDDLILRSGLDSKIGLGSSDKSRAYEAGNVVALRYESGHIPDEGILADDLVDMASLLRVLYRQGPTVIVPGDLAPEIAEAEHIVQRAAGRDVPPKTGFRANAKERRAIELRAMDLAVEYFEALGARAIRDVSASRPYDLVVTLADGDDITVEVKGTVGDGAEVLLTRGEVEHHLRAKPANALVVVHGIRLDGDPHAPKATGGERRVFSPWEIGVEHLLPLAYRYSIPTLQKAIDPPERVEGC